MDGFERRKEQSRAKIRRAAAEHFSRFGIARVSMDDVARQAGVSKATIYNNFGDKESLVKDYVKTSMNRFIEQGRAILNTDKPYREKLRSLSLFLAGATSDSNYEAETPANANIEFSSDREIKIIRESFIREISDLFLELVRDGKKQGQVNPDLSEEAFQIYFKSAIGIISDPKLHYRFHRDPQLAQDLISLLIFGLSGQND